MTPVIVERVSRVYLGDMAVDPEGARFRLGDARGHYESWFLRGNHPTRPLAFWIRYTVTSPASHPQDAEAEMFAIFFDGERGRHVVARQHHPLTDALFPTSGLGVRIAGSRLERDRAHGSVQAAGPSAVAITWELAFEGGGAPLLLLPERLYAGGFPKAKSLVIRPNVRFKGHLHVGPEKVETDGWQGSLNHNWGTRHTDRYAWGQVAGFPDAPETTLEIATARLRVGPWLTPPMTPIVLRHERREYRLNALHTLFGRASLHGLEWSFKGKGQGISLHGTMRAAPLDVVTLFYANPPGGAKICINTKIATCDLELVTPTGSSRLRSPHGAAFELLVDKLSDTGLTNLPAPI